MVMLVRSPAGLRKKREKKKRPIVVKRVFKVPQRGRATGSWKIAYADFVTALMAFFLLMWLVGTNSQERLRDISSYFKMPLAVALTGGPSPGDASSVIQGGGRSLTAGEGKLRLNPDLPPRVDDVASAGARVRQEELERLRRLDAESASRLFRVPTSITPTSDCCSAAGSSAGVSRPEMTSDCRSIGLA